MKQKIRKLATTFRNAIEAAKVAGEFDSEFPFSQFPHSCCGDATDLLAQYLLEHNIKSTYVCGTRYDENQKDTQSHAWLLVDKLIVDITGDQFSNQSIYYNYNIPVYVGTSDSFHFLFKIEKRDVHKFDGLENYGYMYQTRLFRLYDIIKKYCAMG